MSFWKNAKQTAVINRLVEEKIYEQVLREIESGVRRDGLWAKAIQNSRGNEKETQALYIQYRVQSIKDEHEISEEISRQYDHSRIIIDTNPIDKYDEDGYTPLMKATKAMDIATVITLIGQGANPKLKDDNFGSSTALSMAKLALKRAKNIEDQHAFQKIIDALEPIT